MRDSFGRILLLLVVEECVGEEPIRKSDSLCAKLSAAQDAEERGNAQAKAGALGAYSQELEAQVDKTLTQHQASVLMTLASTLY